MIFARLALAAALVASAAAEFQILSPGADVWWIAKSTNTLTWTCNDPTAADHPTFTVFLANKDVKVQTAPIAIISIQQNFECSKLITADQVSALPGTGYTILFSNPLNQTDVFATSAEFEIKALGSAYPSTTPGFVSSSASPSSTSGGAAANSSATTTPGKGNSASGVSFNVKSGLAALAVGVLALAAL